MKAMLRRLLGVQPTRSGAEVIEERLMREWIQQDDEAVRAELGTDEEARALIRDYRLYVAFNTHATEERWEVAGPGGVRTFYCPEYPDGKTLGDAVRACVAKLSAMSLQKSLQNENGAEAPSK